MRAWAIRAPAVHRVARLLVRQAFRGGQSWAARLPQPGDGGVLHMPWSGQGPDRLLPHPRACRPCRPTQRRPTADCEEPQVMPCRAHVNPGGASSGPLPPPPPPLSPRPPVAPSLPAAAGTSRCPWRRLRRRRLPCVIAVNQMHATPPPLPSGRPQSACGLASNGIGGRLGPAAEAAAKLGRPAASMARRRRRRCTRRGSLSSATPRPAGATGRR